MTRDATALAWVARLFLAIGIGAAVVCGSLAAGTLRFISESVESEGTVVDWTQGRGTAGRSAEPGAYYRIVEVVASDGRRMRGEVEVGVDMNQLQMGERLTVRYRPADPSRMREGSVAGMWLGELVTAVLAIAFGSAGAFLRKQAKTSQ